RYGRAVPYVAHQGVVVDGRPDCPSGPFLGPDIAVGEPDLAPEGALAARAAQPQDSRRYRIALIPIEFGVARDDRRDSVPAVERREQFLRYQLCVHVKTQ